MKERTTLGRMFGLATILLLGLLLSGCATTNAGQIDGQSDSNSTEMNRAENIDPYESFNRKVFAFNDRFDKAFGKPIAEVYAGYIPLGIRRGIGNFFANLWEPGSAINALLQGQVHKAASTTTRFVINSTAGILGIFDVASKLGVMEQEEDFGETLAVWGVPDGPYLVVPFLGPSSVRDFSSLIVEWYTTDLVPILFEDEAWLAIVGLRLLDSRASVLGLDETLDLQVDPYLFLRESYRQSRLIQIYNGYPPVEEDEFEAELFAE